MEFNLMGIAKDVEGCTENCYPFHQTDFEKDINQALLLVNSTITTINPYGFISQKEAFQKMRLHPTTNGSQLAYQLGPGLGYLKPHKEVGKNWILTNIGLAKVNQLQNMGATTPLIDKCRRIIAKSYKQNILFISEAPGKDAWNKHVLVSTENNFLTNYLLPAFQITFEDFEKYLFWLHYSNCFPGVKENGDPMPPKDSTCFNKWGKRFLHEIAWDGIVLMGNYAYMALGNKQNFSDFLTTYDGNPAIPGRHI